MGNGAAVGDYDGDGYLDVLLLGQAGHQTKLFHNVPAPDGGRRFTDVTDAAGLGGITSNARVAQFVDLSGSGRPDLVIAADYIPGGPGGPSQILRNNGDGTFTDVTAGSGFDPTGYIVGGMTFADYDGSGRQSIYLSYWTEELAGDPARPVVKGAFPGQNRLYRNLGDYRFEDVTYSSGIGEYHADSFTAVFTDFTGDQLPDHLPGQRPSARPVLPEQGDGRFQDAGDAAGLTRAGNSMGVATTVGTDGAAPALRDPHHRSERPVRQQPGEHVHAERAGSERDPLPQRGGAVRHPRHGLGMGHRVRGHGPRRGARSVRGPGHACLRGRRSAHLADATSILFLGDATGSRFSVAKDTGCDVPGDQRALVVFDYDRDGSPDLLITQVAGPTVLLQNHTSREALADGRTGRRGRRRHRCPSHGHGRRPDDDADPARGWQLPRRSSTRGSTSASTRLRSPTPSGSTGRTAPRPSCSTSRRTRSCGCRS